MIRSYFKIALRNLLRHKTFTLINVSGLAIGMAACIQIALFINDELSFDRFHTKGDRIYRVEGHYGRGGQNMEPAATSNFGLLPLLKTAFPEIEDAARMSMGREVVRFGHKTSLEDHIGYADSSFFELFSFQFLKGDSRNAIKQPNTMVATESFAKKYFGDAEPMGQMIRVGEALVKITGLIKDMPPAAHFHADAVISVRTVSAGYPGWSLNPSTCGTSHYTYLLLPEHYNYQRMQSQFPAFISKYIGKEHNKYMSLNLQPLRNIHLYSHSADQLEANGDIVYIYLFGAVAVVILLMACLNYINLTTARSLERAREIGLRKVTGASRGQLILQFLGESVLITFMALLLACLLTTLSMPLFNSLSGKTISFNLVNNYRLAGCLLGLTLLLGLVAGIYPAFFLSSFNIARVLKGGSTGTKSGSLLRKSFVTLQFCISVILIISTLLIYSQLNFIRNKKLGMNPEHILTLELTPTASRHYEALKTELLKNSRIHSIGSANNELTSGSTNWRQYQWKNNNRNDNSIATMDVDEGFLQTLKAEMKEGRWFSREYPADSSDSYVINETAARLMNMERPLNEPLLGSQFNNSSWSDKKGRIIGVMKDFHFASLHQEVKPVVFNLQSSKTGQPAFAWLRISGGDIPASLQFIKDTWQKFEPEYPLSYSFMDQDIEDLYLADANFLNIFIVFACLAICIACLGIFGLTTYTAAQRTREIGIRKAIGASVASIVVLLSKDLAKLIVLSFVVAVPIAWYIMQAWLQGYAYKITIGPVPFLLAGLLTVLIAWMSVSYQSIKAALMNPVKSLRSE